jgi:hypothetical protein
MKLRQPLNEHSGVFTMTIEGRPEIQNSDEYWKQEYSKQRKDRLTDAVHDYLDDADTSILAFYNDLRDIIVEMNTYHKTFADKAEGALLLVHGKPKDEKEQNDIPGEPSY